MEQKTAGISKARKIQKRVRGDKMIVKVEDDDDDDDSLDIVVLLNVSFNVLTITL